MTPSDITRLRDLLDRVGRIAAAEDWTDDLNPAQRAALAYLARANRFSRAPSHVADYLCATRGTVSQTLKALERKGYVLRTASQADRRGAVYEVTDQGHAALARGSAVAAALGDLPAADLRAATAALEKALAQMLERRGQRAFGLCRECRYHRAAGTGQMCSLLNVALRPEEADALCHEFAAG